MKRLFSLFFVFLFLGSFGAVAYSAPAERIFDDYGAKMYDDAEAPVNEQLINAKTNALIRQGKVTRDKNSIGSITVEKGAVIMGPLGTNVDMGGGAAVFDDDGADGKKSKKKK